MAELEGFICPLCMQRLPGVLQLEEHVREKHDHSATGKMKSNFRQFLGKAKGKAKTIITQDNVSEGAAAVATSKVGVSDGEIIDDTPITNVSGIDISYWPPQETGHVRNLTDMFRVTRDAKVQRIAVESNRLLVRLEKLLKLLKNEHSMKSKQLKSLEQEIVPWKKDSDQKRCMKCRREFNVRRRRHHCRLCGDVICKRCSNFYPFTEAYQLITDSPDYDSIVPSSGVRPQSKKKKIKKLLKDSDDEDDDDSSEEMRVCGVCEGLLVRKLVRMRSERKQVMTGLYERMQSLMIECDKLKVPYLEMAESLLNGEFHYNLQDAQEQRQVLIQRYEWIDKLSKQILNLTHEEEGNESAARTNLKLQRSVRIFASTYLQDNLLTLQSLPTRIQLRKIREQIEREAEEMRQTLIRQKEEERILIKEAAAAAAIKNDKSLTEMRVKGKLDVSFKETLEVTFGIGGSSKGTDSSSGWSAAPVISDTLDDEFDPFELQRQQLLSYIQQAKDAKKFDEMKALQESLAEIERMMEQNITI